MAFIPKLTHKIPLECCDNNSRDYQFDTQTLKLPKHGIEMFFLATNSLVFFFLIFVA